MSARLFQGIVLQMHDAVERVVGVLDENFMVSSCSELGLIGRRTDITIQDINLNFDVFTRGGYTYKPFGLTGLPEYVAFVEGTDATAAKFASLMAVSLANIKQQFDEKHDSTNFVKNVILDNIPPGDIFIKARELHFDTETSHVVLLIRLGSHNDISVLDIIQNLFPEKNKDFVINITDDEIAIVKEVKEGIETEDIEKLARSIADTLSSEFYIHASVGIGTVVEGIRDLARSFKEAQISLEVGKVFDTEKLIISYDNLGIARLIYQLPTTFCETFLNEVFKNGDVETLDQETLFTIQKFFENNLNVSES